MTQTAIDALSELLAQVPQDQDVWRGKAGIIWDFSERFSAEVLRRSGFVDPESDAWQANMLVEVFEGEKLVSAPHDAIGTLTLSSVPAALDAKNLLYVPVDHRLVFGKGRVLDWNIKKDRANRVMTYEEATRFVVFWLAEKILQIIRKNEWDRIKHLPDLFDRLMNFMVSPPVIDRPLPRSYIEAQELRIKYGLQYDPMSLLTTIGDTEPEMSVRLYNALNWGIGLYDKDGHTPTPAKRLGDVVTRSKQQMWRCKNFGRKSLLELINILEHYGLSLNMNLPPEVEEWYIRCIG